MRSITVIKRYFKPLFFFGGGGGVRTKNSNTVGAIRTIPIRNSSTNCVNSSFLSLLPKKSVVAQP